VGERPLPDVKIILTDETEPPMAGGFMNASYNGPGKPFVVEFNDRE
jgi:hypothetical protein